MKYLMICFLMLTGCATSMSVKVMENVRTDDYECQVRALLGNPQQFEISNNRSEYVYQDRIQQCRFVIKDFKVSEFACHDL